MNAGLIQSLREQLRHRWEASGQRSGLPALDELLGTTGLAKGAIHEVLALARHGQARSFALILARAGLGTGAVAWCGPRSTSERWYLPAAERMGLAADRFIALRTVNAKETLWALAECLRCKGVSVAIATIEGSLHSIDARRLQLAARQGGGIGILLRDASARSMHYAAATRWLVEPLRGTSDVQRWKVTLLHGQGGHLERSIGLEMSRETHRVRAFEELADQPAQTTASRTVG